MPGLIEQNMSSPAPEATAPALPPGAPAAPALPAAAPAQAGPGAEPFSQRDMDIFVANGVKLIHSGAVSDQIIAQIVDADNPVPIIADVTLNVVGRLEESAGATGKKPSLAVVAQGGNVLMGEVIRVAEAGGMKKKGPAPKHQAFALAISKYLDNALKSGAMTQEQLSQMADAAANTPAGQKILQQGSKLQKGKEPVEEGMENGTA